jgi:hypothetical protein
LEEPSIARELGEVLEEEDSYVGHTNTSSHLQLGKTQPKKIGSWLEWLDAKRPPSFQPFQPTPNFFQLCFS